MNRLVSLVYGGLFLNWLLWFCVPDVIRYPGLAVPLMTHRMAPFLACLLLSHWWVRRGEFWAAVLPLLFSLLFLRFPLGVWVCF